MELKAKFNVQMQLNFVGFNSYCFGCFVTSQSMVIGFLILFFVLFCFCLFCCCWLVGCFWVCFFVVVADDGVLI